MASKVCELKATASSSQKLGMESLLPTNTHPSLLYRQASGLLQLIHFTTNSFQTPLKKVEASAQTNMDMGKQDEIEAMALSPPSMSSMHIAGSNGFGHNIDFMSQAYIRNRNSEIDIEDDSFRTHQDHPLPIFLKVALSILHFHGFKCK